MNFLVVWILLTLQVWCHSVNFDLFLNSQGCVGLNETSASIGKEKLSSLPCTFDVVCLISWSKDCSLITKKELVHKIFSNNLEIEETSKSL
jgi:hypothetical protein